MKNLFLVIGFLLALTVFAIPSYSQVTNRIGPMLSFTSGDFDEVGIGAVAEFGVADQLSVAPQFILYFPGNNVSLFEINLNANYYFLDHDVFELYGLGGLNIARASFDSPVTGESRSNTELGLNLGAGTNIEIGQSFVPFAELRFTVGDYSQLALGLGIKFNLGGR